MPDPIDDARALCRLLYALERGRGASPERLAAIEAAGRRLATACRFGRLEAGSLGHRKVAPHGREGLRLLVACGWSGEVASLIEVAAKRVEEALR